MHSGRRYLLGCFCALTLCATGLIGCQAGGGGGGGGGTDDPQPDDAGELQVSFDAEGGNFAVAEDEEGNAYTFREQDGRITEANIRTPDGRTLKASLDENGNPVKFRAGDNSNADLVYAGEAVRIRYTDAGGRVDDMSGFDAAAAKERVQARRMAHRDKRRVVMQGATQRVETLTRGLEQFEEVVESILDEEENPNSPLRGTPLEEPIRKIGRIASVVDVAEVDDPEVLDTDLDEIPTQILDIAGQNYTLFEAEGFCMAENPFRVDSRLSFDSDGVLNNEFDKNLLFDVSEGGGTEDRGFTINWQALTPINAVREDQDLGYTVGVNPVFTGTGLAEDGSITVERRFLADIESQVEVFTVSTARAEQLFNAAFINGELIDGILEFDLVLIDLADETPAEKLGRLRYYNQNDPPPLEEDRLYRCEVIDQAEDIDDVAGAHLNCDELQRIGPYQPFEVSFISRDRARNLDYDWFVSAGYGYVEDPFSPISTTVTALEEGPLEISLIVSDLDVQPAVFELYTCEVFVGDVQLGVALDCPGEMTMDEFGFFSVTGAPPPRPPGGDEAVGPAAQTIGEPFYEWYVLGTSDFWVVDPFATQTDIGFFDTGHFEVNVAIYNPDGTVEFGSCPVHVDVGEFDECEVFEWYGDGVCDDFCLYPDPDCLTDWCADNGYYGDGFCDPDCPQPDPDCGGFDECEDYGWYGDGECDLFCPRPDPDCDVIDWCEDLGWYGDGVCDVDCPKPDPDCEEFDWCDEYGWYGDGECDPDCPHPDPDCEQSDWCDEYGWYGDGECDFDCPRPDPDCDEFDWCDEYGWYGDGECDFDCPRPDPDCEQGDWCDDLGYYGDGYCDIDCPRPDPDCEEFDWCDEYGWYGDGECDFDCPRPDPDCEEGDWCDDLGYYGDGFCDLDCPRPDPDCEEVDFCEAWGWYGDGECDPDCPRPDPDCEVGDWCADLGYYGDGFCDIDCPQPDPDCEEFDWCEAWGWYGDGECDDCPLPDPDCGGGFECVTDFDCGFEEVCIDGVCVFAGPA